MLKSIKNILFLILFGIFFIKNQTKQYRKSTLNSRLVNKTGQLDQKKENLGEDFAQTA